MRSLLSSRVTYRAGADEVETLVIYLADGHLNPSDFGTLIDEELKRDIRPDQVLLLVRDGTQRAVVSRLDSEPRLRSTMQTLKGRVGFSVSAFGADGAQTERLEVCCGGASIAYNDFKNRVMTSVFVQRGGFVEATAAYHFSNPSKRHTNRFMRLANALVSRAEVSFFAFCCLPHVPPDTTVAYVDTPAMFGLVAAISELRQAFGFPGITSDCFGSYGGMQDYSDWMDEGVAVLISASSSGSLAKLVRERVRHLGNERIVHVAYLGKKDSEHPVVCNLKWDALKNPGGKSPNVGDWHEGDCQLCTEGSIPIRLYGDQFEIPAPLPHPLLVTKDDAPKSLAATLGHLGGTGAFRVGLGSETDRTPRGFHVSSEALAANGEFIKELDYAVSRSVPASTGVIVKLDEHSDWMVKKVLDVLGRQAVVMTREELHRAERSDDTKAVVMVAAAVNSGRSLQDVSRDLRNAFPRAPQIYLVGMAKPESESRRTELRSSLTRTSAIAQHEFVAVQSMLLPGVRSPTPWDQELELLKRLEAEPGHTGRDHKVVARIAERVARLGNRSEALSDDLFVPNHDALPIKLEHGFVFWPSDLSDKKTTTQADVFFTISSVLQNLRQNAGARTLVANGVQHTILEPSNFGRFNDAVIQASILRAATVPELNYSADRAASREMARIVRRIIESSRRPRGAAAAEMLLSIAVGRLKLDAQDMPDLLRDVPEASEWVRFLIEVCRASRQ